MTADSGGFVAGPVEVSVPATSANLGPGYDCLGLALGLRDRLRAEVVGSGLEIEVSGEGADAVPRDESHLVVRAMRLAFDALGERPPGLRLRCVNAIPHARGLGSSSAAIVGGLALARALVRGGSQRLSDDAAFAMAATLEGHPDNVAPAWYGGFVISGHDDDFWAVPCAVDQRVQAVVLVPPYALATETARGLLPEQVSHADAAANAARTALLVAALAGAPEQLLRATRDLLHQEHRRPAMPQTLALVDRLREAGLAAVVSGAGPTVLALVTAAERERLAAFGPEGWRVLPLRLERDGVRVE